MIKNILIAGKSIFNIFTLTGLGEVAAFSVRVFFRMIAGGLGIFQIIVHMCKKRAK